MQNLFKFEFQLNVETGKESKLNSLECHFLLIHLVDPLYNSFYQTLWFADMFLKLRQYQWFSRGEKKT